VTGAPSTKRLRSNNNNNCNGITNERVSGAPSSQLLEGLNLRLQEQTLKLTGLVQGADQRILGALITRLDGIAADLKLVGERVASAEAKVAVIRSYMDKVNEHVNNLEHKVCDLNALKESVGELEAKLSSQQMATQTGELRMQEIPFLEGKNLKTLYHKLCFSLQLTPPPKFTNIFGARKTQSSSVHPVVIIETITMHRTLPAYGQTTT